MLTAEYGGTSGKSIEPGMVVEEPDIEIGAGVSSKGMYLAFVLSFHLLTSLTAISRRMATDQGGKRGPQSSRGATVAVPHERFRRADRGMDHSGPPAGQERDSGASNNGVGVPPAVPGFGFSFPGMPFLPPGFMMNQQAGSNSATPNQGGQGT